MFFREPEPKARMLVSLSMKGILILLYCNEMVGVNYLCEEHDFRNRDFSEKKQILIKEPDQRVAFSVIDDAALSFKLHMMVSLEIVIKTSRNKLKLFGKPSLKMIDHLGIELRSIFKNKHGSFIKAFRYISRCFLLHFVLLPKSISFLG